MITRAWLESEIEKALAAKPTAQAVYDLAALITVRGYLCAQESSEEKKKEAETQTVNLLDYCTDLDKCPTLEQVETALGSVAINSRDDARRAKDALVWADILRR